MVPPDPKGSRGFQLRVEELNESRNRLVHQQHDQVEGQEDAVLLQGDQGLPKPRDLVDFGFPLGTDVEVDDAEEEEQEKREKDEFWLQ